MIFLSEPQHFKLSTVPCEDVELLGNKDEDISSNNLWNEENG